MDRYARMLSLLAVVVLVGLASRGGSAALASSTGGMTRLLGHVPDALSQATRLPDGSAGTPGSDPLTLTLILNRTDQRGFEAALEGIQSPASPNYQRYLTQHQLADRFGPSQSAYDRVLQWLLGQGFALTQGSANRLTLTVSGTRAQAEQAFKVKIGDFELNGRRFYANDTNPLLPASVAGAVQAVQGLSSLPQPRTQILTTAIVCGVLYFVAVTLVILAFTLINPFAFYLGLAAAHADYACLFTLFGEIAGFVAGQGGGRGLASHAGNTGAAPGSAPAAAPSQKVGLLEYDTYHPADVANWLNLARPITDPAAIGRLSTVPVNGGVASPGPEEAEVLLDIDFLLAETSPQTNVVVYDAPPSTSFQTLFNAMINDGDTVISNSWSSCEDQTTLADVQSIDSILANAAAAGITVINATGDSGSSCLDGSPNTVGVPADAPHATAVGGTTQTSGTGLTYGHETWWDGSQSTPRTGQGGFGTSRFFPRPAYQNGLNVSTMRSVPDVALNADPVGGLGICQADDGGCPGGKLYGGTSMSAPEMAAIVASLNQSKGSNLGFLNPQVYPLAGTAGFHNAASMGSDFAHVGLGSPNPDQLRLLLLQQTLAAVSPSKSLVRAALPNTVADGTTQAVVQVNLLDAQGHVASGKNVNLAVGLVGGGSSHAVASAPSGPSSVNGGAVTFTVTDTFPESLTFTATDTTDGVVLQQTPMLTFVTPPAVAANILAEPASPTPVAADGSATARVTVTLQNAQNLPATGKTIALSQGSGHSIVTDSGVSDAMGKAAFTVTDTVAENVTYTAVDVTDGNLPVPGSATVTFSNSTGTNCPVIAPVVAPGYAVTNFITGFASCGAPFGLAFDAGGNLFVDDLRNGFLLKFGPTGGAVTAANHVGTFRPLDNDGLAFGKDGKLYMALLNDATVQEVNPATGTLIRTVANTPQFPLGLAVDPLSGDLFVSIGANSNSIYRISNPASGSPTIGVYSSVGNADGLVFAPDGTLYTAINFPPPGDPTLDNIVKIGGTNTGANAGVVLSTIATVPGVDGLGVGIGAGGAVVIYGNRNDGKITKVDTSTPVATLTDIYSGGSRGDFATVGPDGCLYATQDDRILKVTNADGSCALTPAGVQPALALSPAAVSPNPQQGMSTTFTATLSNVPNPATTPITFAVTGTNTAAQLVYADSNGRASFTYTGVHTGTDSVVAFTGSGAAALVSNNGWVTWTPGPHTSFVTLNPSVTAGDRNRPATVTGNLSDLSATPAAPLAGKTLSFSLSGAPGQTCVGTTDGAGTASCTITPTVAAGSYTLSVNFAGTPEQNLPSNDQTAFAVVQPLATTVAYTGPTTIAVNNAVTLTATLKDGANAPVAARSLSFTLGTSGNAQTCAGTTDGTGTASCTINNVNQPLGPANLAVSFAGDAGYVAASTSVTVQIVAIIDTTPPTTTASTAPSANAGGWNTSPVTVTLTATDPNPGSGVATTYYAIDLASCTPQATATCSTYSAPFSLATDGRHTVTYFSKDNAGNLEAAHSLAVKLDQVAPVTTLSKASNSTDCAAQVTLTATDATAGVDYLEYQLDGGAWTRYRGPVVVFNSHTLTYRAHDVAGNVEATHSFTVPKSSRSRCPSPFG